tara:strand:- start:1104 stop:1340 length:237 start_codon:yes stop_codon:yes gene_type:complete
MGSRSDRFYALLARDRGVGKLIPYFPTGSLVWDSTRLAWAVVVEAHTKIDFQAYTLLIQGELEPDVPDVDLYPPDEAD